MIVAGPEGFVKGQYRKFNIKSQDITPGDDYAMMREVLERRFKRLLTDKNGQEAAASEETRIEETDILAADAEAEAAVSRIEAPAPPPRNQSGADSIAFGVLPVASQSADPAADNFVPAIEVEGDEDPEPSSDEFPSRPDLVLIDGGAGQLSVAREVFAGLGVDDICIIGVAKGPDRDAGREHFHIPGQQRPMMLEPRDPVLYFVQRLRDEAHRFAIGTHRAKRSKSIGINPLDEIAGIGPTRRRGLLKHFGSAKAVSRASVEDLKGVGGISGDMAQRIYDFFHEREG
jgi:excinuclease ABC subunit C